jgi:hypothetical protein
MVGGVSRAQACTRCIRRGVTAGAAQTGRVTILAPGRYPHDVFDPAIARIRAIIFSSCFKSDVSGELTVASRSLDARLDGCWSPRRDRLCHVREQARPVFGGHFQLDRVGGLLLPPGRVWRPGSKQVLHAGAA